ncbi:hypothetical protein MRX96_013022 [Rhipicephalus microplus]
MSAMLSTPALQEAHVAAAAAKRVFPRYNGGGRLSPCFPFVRRRSSTFVMYERQVMVRESMISAAIDLLLLRLAALRVGDSSGE